MKKQPHSYFLKKKNPFPQTPSLLDLSPWRSWGSGPGKLLFSNILSNTNKQLLEHFPESTPVMAMPEPGAVRGSLVLTLEKDLLKIVTFIIQQDRQTHIHI